jgi:malate dehydrogenase
MKIGVIGAAGIIGSATAFCIGAKQLADTIALIDLPGDALNFQTLDLTTGVSGAGINVVSGGLELLEDASLVIMTASVPLGKVSSRQEMLSANLTLCAEVARGIRRYCPDTILLQVTNPIEPLGYATFRTADTKPQKTIGYSINDTFRFRMLLADSLKTNPSNVEAYVIGEHGDTQVPVFSNVKVDGRPVDISAEVKQNILSKIPNIFKELEYYREKTGRTAAWTSAIGIADIVQAITTDAKEVFACATILQGEYGQSDICLGVPAVIGAGGVERILELSLDPEEKEAFGHSVATVRKATAKTIEMVPDNSS